MQGWLELMMCAVVLALLDAGRFIRRSGSDAFAMSIALNYCHEL
jgi:hypothetical protein